MATVVGLFDNTAQAQRAVEQLRSSGINANDIGVAMRSGAESTQVATDTDTGGGGGGAVTGAVGGGVLGGLAGLLVGIGALAIPGVGPIIAAGPLAAALGGAALGAAGGGLVGALTGAGVPEEEAKWYDERVRGGGFLVTVNARGRYAEAQMILHEHGARDFQSGQSAGAYRSWGEASPEFRRSYETRYGGADWDRLEPAHRFGYEAYGRSRERGASGGWRSAESDLRSEWERSGSGSWEENRGHIRHGYDYGRGRSRFRDDDLDATDAGEERRRV